MSKIPFLRHVYKTPILRDWLAFEGQRGCLPIEGGLCLQMAKSPPPLPGTVAAQAAAQAAKETASKTPATPPPPKKDTAAAILWWMVERRDKKLVRTQPKSPPQPPKPFDLYDIPQAMRAAGFEVAARFAQRWLDAPAYNAFFTGAEGKTIEQRYPDTQIDSRSITLNWLLKNAKIERRYDALLRKLKTTNALDALARSFTRHLESHTTSHDLDTGVLCRGDLQALHSGFQFQFEAVGLLDTLTDTLGMTDVTAALANFNFYAAVANAEIRTTVYNLYNTPSGTQQCRKSTVTVTHIWVYAKDSYSFQDDGASSQYLGHWNRHGVIVLPAALAASVGMKTVFDIAKDSRDYPYKFRKALDWLKEQRLELWNEQVARLPVDTDNTLAVTDVHYPVRNRDYQQWRETHQRGGDFLVFSDLRRLRLHQPIVLDMPEVCR
ncbi:MAG: DUF6402 family protein [Limnohabitans sp.]